MDGGRLLLTWRVVCVVTVLAGAAPVVNRAVWPQQPWRLAVAGVLLLALAVARLSTRPRRPPRMNHVDRQVHDPELAGAAWQVAGGRRPVGSGRDDEAVDVARRRTWDLLFGSAPLILVACVWLAPAHGAPTSFQAIAVVCYGSLVVGIVLARIRIARIDRVEHPAAA